MPDEVQAELPYDRALELGCGTGFFLLNLIQAGVARRGSVTDLSPGMVKVATRNGQSLGLDIDGRVADAEGIPYEDNTFDLVVGHAVLHHIPDVELSLREVVRVLRPGGRFLFAGEPTTVGNGYARALADLTWNVTIRAVKLPGLGGWRRPQAEIDENSRAAALEWVVDLHTFEPKDLERMATNAGAVQVSHRQRGVHRRDVRLAGPDFRSDRAARAAGLELGKVRVRWLEGAELGGCQRLAARSAEGLVLQRDGHRGQTLLSGVSVGLAFSTDDVRYLRSESGAVALAAVAGFGLTDATRVADTAAARARFGDRAPVLVETTLLRRRAADKLERAVPRFCGVELAVHRRGAATSYRGAGRPAPGWPAGRRSLPLVHDATCSIGTETGRVARIGGCERWAAISTRYAWQWRATTWDRRPNCAVPTRWTR